jgi:hypothetical protein
LAPARAAAAAAAAAAPPPPQPTAASEAALPSAIAALDFGGPLIISLPYSTGIARAVDWTLPTAAYARPGSARKAAILFAAWPGHGRLGAQFARILLSQQLLARHASCKHDTSVCTVCTPPLPAAACAPPRKGHDVFSSAARSVFCIEPPGDSPERSHFFVAALAGCVPVRVHGGHKEYDETKPAYWPWMGGRGAGDHSSKPADRPWMGGIGGPFMTALGAGDIATTRRRRRRRQLVEAGHAAARAGDAAVGDAGGAVHTRWFGLQPSIAGGTADLRASPPLAEVADPDEPSAGCGPLPQPLDYSRFTLELNASQLRRAQVREPRGGGAHAGSSGWIDELTALAAAADEPNSRVAQLRAALADASRAFVYAERECGSDDCDAFGRLRASLFRAWRIARAAEELRQRDAVGAPT